MSTIAKAVVQRSWAEIVTGVDNVVCTGRAVEDAMFDVPSHPSDPVSTLPGKLFKPGLRGARTCLCYGRLLVILGHYGWIEARGTIDHPDARKNGGRIYVRWCDVVGDVTEGQIVCFYLYADGQGLGAEHCQAALACDIKKIGSLLDDGEEFNCAVRSLQHQDSEPDILAQYAQEFILEDPKDHAPSQAEVDLAGVDSRPYCTLSASAIAFVPMASPLQPLPRITSPLSMGIGEHRGSAICARIAELFCDESDDESGDEFCFHSAAHGAPHTVKSPRGELSDGSTSVGELSDSDACDDDISTLPRHFRPPPGLSLPNPPPCLFPPPGLVPPPPGLA